MTVNLCEGRYEIDDNAILGQRGGFAIVVKARDTKLNTDVALKIFRSAEKGLFEMDRVREVNQRLQDAPRLVRGFISEIHNVFDVPVSTVKGLDEQAFATSDSSDVPVIVMRYIAGSQLKAWVAQSRTPPPLERIAHNLLQVFKCFRQLKILHRDVRPENILITSSNEPVLIDYSLSCYCGGNPPTSLDPRLFNDRYWAPELKDGGPAFSADWNSDMGVAADLYSLGLVLCEQTLPDRPTKVRETELRSIGYSDSFIALLSTLMHSSPVERLDALKGLRHAGPPPEDQPRRRAVSGGRLVVAAAIATIGLAAATMYGLNGSGGRVRDRNPARAPESGRERIGDSLRRYPEFLP